MKIAHACLFDWFSWLVGPNLSAELALGQMDNAMLCSGPCYVNDLIWNECTKGCVQIWGATAAPIQSAGNPNGWEQRLSDFQGKQGLNTKNRRNLHQLDIIQECLSGSAKKQSWKNNPSGTEKKSAWIPKQKRRPGYQNKWQHRDNQCLSVVSTSTWSSETSSVWTLEKT